MGMSPSRVVQLFFLVSSIAHGYQFVRRTHGLLTPTSLASARSLTMFLGGESKKLIGKADTTKIGTTTVPSVGIGTISWSSDSCEFCKCCVCVFCRS